MQKKTPEKLSVEKAGYALFGVYSSPR